VRLPPPTRPLILVECLVTENAPNGLDELPLGDEGAALVKRTRAEVRDVLDLSDDRMLVIVGPCSVHDPVAALDYARRLIAIRARLADDLLIVMRVYFERSRPVTAGRA
jgi:3-deoxy-7-phosphoheptulonate synthase